MKVKIDRKVALKGNKLCNKQECLYSFFGDMSTTKIKENIFGVCAGRMLMQSCINQKKDTYNYDDY